MFADVVENGEFLIKATVPIILLLFVRIDSSDLPD